LSWNNASQACESYGGYLATILSVEELDFFNAFKSNPDANYWIGATDLQAEGTFAWSNGDAWNFSMFLPGEPNGGTSENCLSVARAPMHVFIDLICGLERRFVCKRLSLTYYN